MANQENIGSLEEEALKRKARLKTWKRKHDEIGKEGDTSEEGAFSLPRRTSDRKLTSMANQENIGSLEEEALKRKERLKAWKRKHDETGKEGDNSEEGVFSLPRPKFRSYRPQGDTLKENILPDAKPGDVEAEVKDQLASANSRVVIEELDITNLAPRKPDWDVKRDVAKKLQKLERRTQKAIAELIRERLKKGQEDLAMSVNIGANVSQNLDVDED